MLQVTPEIYQQAAKSEIFSFRALLHITTLLHTNLKIIALIKFYFESFHLHSLLLGDWSTRTGVLAKGARTDDGRGDEEGDVMAAGVA